MAALKYMTKHLRRALLVGRHNLLAEIFIGLVPRGVLHVTRVMEAGAAAFAGGKPLVDEFGHAIEPLRILQLRQRKSLHKIR